MGRRAASPRGRRPSLGSITGTIGVTYRKLTWILLVAYAAYYIVLCFFLPVPKTVNGLLDDSFYYLQVARNVARGLGSSFDGVEATNGYHPLWMLLLVPTQAIAGSRPGAGLTLALGLSMVLGICSLLALRRILVRECDCWTAAAGMLLFAWPRFFGQTINLLETGLILLLYLLTIGLLLRPGVLTTAAKAGLGVLLGLGALARLDSIFLLIAIVLFGFLRAAQRMDLIKNGRAWDDFRGGIASRLWSNLWPLALTTLVVAPYLIWNWSTFGRLQPVSGAIKSSFPHPRPHLEYLRQFPDFTILLLLGAIFFAASFRRGASRIVHVLGLFGLAGILHMIYTVLFMAWGVDRWHFGILIPIGLIGIPWMAHRVFDALAIGRNSAVLWAVLVIGLTGAAGVQALSLRARNERHLAAAREVALWARDDLPVDAVYGMADAGVFAYFSDRRTVNLDGLINNYRYQDALRAGRVVEYLREKGIGYIFDQYVYGRPEWISGRYESRIFRFWVRPENRPAGEITLYRDDEVHRVNLLARWTAEDTPEPGALILYRYRPEEQR